MATRSNLKITVNGHTTWLYRHWDGYLAETGADVAELGKKLVGGQVAKDNEAIVNYFTSQAYDDGRPVYHLTEAIHGDIEHLYQVDITLKGTVIIGHKARPENWTCFDYAEGMEENIVRFKLETFIKKVNRDRRESNVIMAQHGGHRYDMLSL